MTKVTKPGGTMQTPMECTRCEHILSPGEKVFEMRRKPARKAHGAMVCESCARELEEMKTRMKATRFVGVTPPAGYKVCDLCYRPIVNDYVYKVKWKDPHMFDRAGAIACESCAKKIEKRFESEHKKGKLI